MAQVDRYVDTDAGNALNGGTNWDDAWDIMSTAEAQNQNLDTANNYWIVHMKGTAADTTAVTVDGWTLSATDYLEFRVDAADRHPGKWSTTDYRLSITDGVPLTISDQYVRFTGLQIESINATATRRVIYILTIAAGGSEIHFSYCIARSYTDNFAVIVLNQSDADLGVLKCWNCVFHHRTGDQATAASNSCVQSNADSNIFYNCTVYGGYRGLNCTSTTAGDVYTLKNCIATNTTATDFNGTSAEPTYDWDYCGSQDNSADDKAGDGNTIAQTFAFTDAANTDMHLTAVSDGIGDADSASVGGLFTDDIDGVARGATWDMGADQYVAAAATATIPIYKMFYDYRRRL